MTSRHAPLSHRFALAALALALATPALARTANADLSAENYTPSSSEHLVQATLWFQVSAEARALCIQSFALARLMLDQDLALKTKEKRAVVVDVDETVLDNSPYEARLVEKNINYPTGWRDWIDEASAIPIPGALEFLKYAHSKGVRVFYVTNRKEEEKEGTRKNLIAAGFPDVSNETLLMRVDPKSSSKEPRRMAIAKNHRISLLVGDNLNDFADVFEKKNIADRMAAVDKLQAEFGKRFIVIPNPMYGDWEAAVFNYDWKGTDAQRARQRRQALRLN
ncbi:MAG: 5'-nucleotidase, lipoprotein e(P4) family [Bdellovibrionales bacterium]|nr:5'-nucleotidase, lipoprotein e(P4) family [Bdellovibrionales bacterium]